ncbi:MAG TPA: hypothetical protein VHX65_10685 [Pirellulales bacterium]|jgi:hypothetical protein|nr:hypothetical protein [Pirellulales bacterium]
MKSVSRLFVGLALAALAGCTHVQLRNNTVNTAAAASDAIVQEVMNNLAMFVYDSNSIPFFSFPNQSSANVTDQANAAGSAGWGRPITALNVKHTSDFLLASLGLSGGVQRTQLEGFTLTPVLEPRKLELMRCAYQQAVSSCGYGQMSQNCPDCQARFNTFYTGDPTGEIGKKAVGGTITSNCLAGPKGPCWFHVGSEKCVPKKCECLYVGEYCGVYVWVDHAGRDQLARLTLAILDYAQNSAPVHATKTVTYNIDQFGLPAPKKEAVGTVSASVNVDEQPESLMNIPESDAVQIEQTLLSRLSADQDSYRRLANQNSDQGKHLLDEITYIQQKLDFLKQQLKAGPLKQQFVPGPQQQTPNGLLQLQLYQNTLLPPSQ